MTILRLVLLPISVLYGVVTALRNLFFELGWLKTYPIQSKAIVVGNLSVGGTGKTPHVQYLANFLQQKGFSVAFLSRGYGRATKGMRIADHKETAKTIGDEPKLYFEQNPNAQVVVAEKRRIACEYLDAQETDNQVILLDDAFQHRAVTAGFSVLLTPYKQPFYKDFMLPTGDLREFPMGAQRADVILVTKCPAGITPSQKEIIASKLKKYHKPVYFSSILYLQPYALSEAIFPSEFDVILVVTAIANAQPLLHFLASQHPNAKIEELKFADHHDFNTADIAHIREKFGNFARDKSILLSTEKDAVKLTKEELKNEIKELPWFIQPIGIQIDKEEEFLNRIENYVREVSRIR